MFEAILFPKTYQKYGHLLTSHGPYIITGRVQYEDFNTTLIADKIERSSIDLSEVRLMRSSPSCHA